MLYCLCALLAPLLLPLAHLLPALLDHLHHLLHAHLRVLLLELPPLALRIHHEAVDIDLRSEGFRFGMGLTGFFAGLEVLEKLVIREFLGPVRIIGLDFPVFLRGTWLG